MCPCAVLLGSALERRDYLIGCDRSERIDEPHAFAKPVCPIPAALLPAALVADVLERSGAQWLDLLSIADDFYEQLPHTKHAGFRVYPPQQR